MRRNAGPIYKIKKADADRVEIELEELSSLTKKTSNMSEKIQKREISLQASERKFRRLFENIEVSIWEEDLSDVCTALESLRHKGRERQG